MTDPEVLFVRRCPSLPHGPPCSTIGAERLNFRVRNGAGCFPFAMITETLWRCQRPFQCPSLGKLGDTPTVSRELHGGRVAPLYEQALGLLVSVSSMHYCTSTSDLSPSDLLGVLRVNLWEPSSWSDASRLDAFSGYHFRT